MNATQTKAPRTEPNPPGSTPGLVGVFHTLAEQHRSVAALLETVRRDPAQRGPLWPTIRTELVSHDRGEVREVMPVLRAHPDLRAYAEQHDAEALDLERIISDLDVLPLDSNAWGEVFDRLAETVLQHAAEEEATVFPAAQRSLGEARALQLDAPFLKAKRQIAEAV